MGKVGAGKIQKVVWSNNLQNLYSLSKINVRYYSTNNGINDNWQLTVKRKLGNWERNIIEFSIGNVTNFIQCLLTRMLIKLSKRMPPYAIKENLIKLLHENNRLRTSHSSSCPMYEALLTLRGANEHNAAVKSLYSTIEYTTYWHSTLKTIFAGWFTSVTGIGFTSLSKHGVHLSSTWLIRHLHVSYVCQYLLAATHTRRYLMI